MGVMKGDPSAAKAA